MGDDWGREINIVSLLLNTIEAFPCGRTTHELFALLDVKFDHSTRLLIQGELNALQKDGTIVLGRDRKWRSITRQPVVSRPAGLPPTATPSQTNNEVMLACPAEFSIEMAPNIQEL